MSVPCPQDTPERAPERTPVSAMTAERYEQIRSFVLGADKLRASMLQIGAEMLRSTGNAGDERAATDLLQQPREPHLQALLDLVAEVDYLHAKGLTSW